jgi:hypothetical protein
MIENHQELYERLLHQAEEIDRLQKETARLHELHEQAPESEKLEIAKQVLPLFEQLYELEKQRKPVDLLLFVLLGMLGTTDKILENAIEPNKDVAKAAIPGASPKRLQA